MQRRAALVLVVITPALLITSCKSSSKSKTAPLVTTNVSATAVAPSTTAAAPASAPAASASATPSPPPAAATSSAPPSASAAPSAPLSPLASGVPTNLDPCQLVTQSEASALAGATFGPGEEEAGGGDQKNCVYGSQTTNVFTVAVGQATSVKEAQAEWAQAQAQAQSFIATQLPAGVHINLDTSNSAGIGDKAANLTGSVVIEGKTIAFSGIYVLTGSVFFAITDLALGSTPPSASAMQAQAVTTLGRV